MAKTEAIRLKDFWKRYALKRSAGKNDIDFGSQMTSPARTVVAGG